MSYIFTTLEDKSKKNYKNVALRMHIAINLQDYMLTHNITKDELAKILNVNSFEIDQLLSGTNNNISCELLSNISKIINIY